MLSCHGNLDCSPPISYPGKVMSSCFIEVLLVQVLWHHGQANSCLGHRFLLCLFFVALLPAC